MSRPTADIGDGAARRTLGEQHIQERSIERLVAQLVDVVLGVHPCDGAVAHPELLQFVRHSAIIFDNPGMSAAMAAVR